jgi:RNA polymerase sigma factor (sigma-70 family)
MHRMPPEVHSLLARARAGCPDAARELFDLFSPDILRIVRRKLRKEVRSVFDSFEFVLMTWEDFYAHAAQEDAFASPENLLGLLGRIARGKVAQVHRDYLDTAKRDLRRQQPLEGLEAGGGPGPVALQQTPEQIVSARDHCDHLLQGLAPEYQQALIMLGEGYSHREIAERLGLNEKTLRRLLQRLRNQGS